MGPPIRIVTRCIATWPISGLAPEPSHVPGRVTFPGSGEDFNRFWILGGPRAEDSLRIIAWRIAIAASQTRHILGAGDFEIPFESGTGAIDGQRYGKARVGGG